ncbi:MAG TPA: hypothetical protein VF794_06715 [Archangium sp.]
MLEVVETEPQEIHDATITNSRDEEPTARWHVLVEIIVLPIQRSCQALNRLLLAKAHGEDDDGEAAALEPWRIPGERVAIARAGISLDVFRVAVDTDVELFLQFVPLRVQFPRDLASLVRRPVQKGKPGVNPLRAWSRPFIDMWVQPACVIALERGQHVAQSFEQGDPGSQVSCSRGEGKPGRASSDDEHPGSRREPLLLGQGIGQIQCAYLLRVQCYTSLEASQDEDPSQGGRLHVLQELVGR